MGQSIKVDIKRLGELEAAFGKEAKRTIRQALDIAGIKCVAICQQRTMKSPAPSGRGAPGAVSSGRYYNSWRYSVSGSKAKGGGASAGYRLRVRNIAPYAAVIEDGRAAGARPPPASALIRWVKKNIGVGGAQARGIAYVIARAIGRRGIKGRKIMQGAVAAMTRRVNIELDNAIDRALAAASGKSG